MDDDQLVEYVIIDESEKKSVNISEQEKEFYGGSRFRPYFDPNNMNEEQDRSTDILESAYLQSNLDFDHEKGNN